MTAWRFDYSQQTASKNPNYGGKQGWDMAQLWCDPQHQPKTHPKKCMLSIRNILQAQEGNAY